MAITWEDAQRTIIESSSNNLIYINNQNTILKACAIAKKYKYSFYDSLIISAALLCNCRTLYSEDMQNGQKIGESLTIVNPFL